MSNGRLGAVDLTANVDTTLYTCPAGKTATTTVAFTNRQSAPVNVKLALSTSAAPATADYLEFNTEIPAFGVLERSAVVVGAGQYLVVTSNVSGVSAVLFGFEE